MKALVWLGERRKRRKKELLAQLEQKLLESSQQERLEKLNKMMVEQIGRELPESSQLTPLEILNQVLLSQLGWKQWDSLKQRELLDLMYVEESEPGALQEMLEPLLTPRQIRELLKMLKQRRKLLKDLLEEFEALKEEYDFPDKTKP